MFPITPPRPARLAPTGGRIAGTVGRVGGGGPPSGRARVGSGRPGPTGPRPAGRRSATAAGSAAVRLRPGVFSHDRAEELSRGAPPAAGEEPAADHLAQVGRH
jgi:hypothetical protein